MTSTPASKYALLKGFSKGVEADIAANIGDHLAGEGLSIEILQGRSQMLSFAVLRAVTRCETLIVHSPLAYAAIYVIVARLLGKTIVGLIWDHYPVTLAGKRFDHSLRRRFLDLLENAAIRFCTHLIVPSQDFLAEKRFARAKAIPFWIPIAAPAVAPSEAVISPYDPLKIIFAGQVNATRGLEEAYEALKAHLGERFELLVASRDPLPHALQNAPNVMHKGFLNRENLRKEMARCDAGLVALAPEFDGPGLPSKTFEYLGAGLRCIFFGKPLAHYSEALVSSGAGIVLGSQSGQPISPDVWRATGADIAACARAFSAHFELDTRALVSHLSLIGGSQASGTSKSGAAER